MPKHRVQPIVLNGRFFNEPNEQSHSVYLPSLIVYLQSKLRLPWRTAIDASIWSAIPSFAQRSNDLAVTWLGHASFLIQVAQQNIIVDPVFNGLTPLFPRLIPSTVGLHQLPAIDLILISHNHRDHADIPTLQAVATRNPQAQVVCPMGDAPLMHSRGFQKVTEMNWWESLIISGVTIHFLPAYHWSGRGLRDRNQALWGSYLIEGNNQRCYFAGDTAHWHHFEEIGMAFPGIEVALMPIGPCSPRWMMKLMHMSPHDAVAAFLALGARSLVPMHWGTYSFGLDDFELPLNLLLRAWDEIGIKKAQRELAVLKQGQTKNYPNFLTATPQTLASLELV